MAAKKVGLRVKQGTKVKTGISMSKFNRPFPKIKNIGGARISRKGSGRGGR